VPNEDLSNHVPWLESKRRSRARRKEARQARSRDRRRKTGAIVAAATLTFAAGGAFAQGGGAGSAAVRTAGSTVSALQSALGITPDGVYGPNTRRAVRNYQRNQGLAVDGIAGPVTLAHLGLASSGSGAATTQSSSQTASNGATASAPNATLARIAACESSGNPAAVSPSGQYRGKYQFSRETWEEYGGTGDPAAAPESVQDSIAAKLLAARGTQPWPVCGK
jgi:peptidoglycan hydrolase-like protein with peptidoglycan-binding domain